MVAWLIVFAAGAGRTQGKFISEYRLDSEVVEIPFDYKEHQILVKGRASGRKDLLFLFDSGASAPGLSGSASELKAAAVGSDRRME